MILVLIFVIILGGAGILYKQLGQKLVPDLLATQAPQKTESTEASLPTTQEGESEKILAPDFTIQIRMPLQSTVFIHCLPHILLTLRETQSPRQLVQSTKELCSEEST